MAEQAARLVHEQGDEVDAHVSKGDETLVKEEQHPQEKEKEAKAGEANTDLCMDASLLSA